jgi:hypothetical protein
MLWAGGLRLNSIFEEKQHKRCIENIFVVCKRSKDWRVYVDAGYGILFGCKSFLRIVRYLKMTRNPVKLDDLNNALDYVSGGAMLNSAVYLCIATGEIHYYSDDFQDDEAPPQEDIEDSDEYVAIPHKNDLSLGKRLVFRFVREVLPDVFDDVEEIFHRKGAYGRFKSLLERRGVLERWYEYEEISLREGLKEWCLENNIAFTE